MYFAVIEASVPESGLTLGEIVASLPHNGSAFFIYALTAVSLWLIWQGSRTRDSRGPTGEAFADASPAAAEVDTTAPGSGGSGMGGPPMRRDGAA